MTPPGLSLRLRISLVAAAVIAVFFLVTATLLERAFRENAEDAVTTRLDAQLLLLMGIVEVSGPGQVQFPDVLPEARLSLPGGGLYARVLDGAARPSGARPRRSARRCGNGVITGSSSAA